MKNAMETSNNCTITARDILHIIYNLNFETYIIVRHMFTNSSKKIEILW